MSIIIEGISVIAKNDALEEKYPGGLKEFIYDAPNQTYVSDGEISRVGFMTPLDSAAFFEGLKKYGLSDDDMATAEQGRGVEPPCDWLLYDEINHGKTIAFGWLKDGTYGPPRHHNSPDHGIALPKTWDDKYALNDLKSVPVDDLEFLRTEENREVYLNKLTGRELHVGRPELPCDSEEGAISRLDRILKRGVDIERRLGRATEANDAQGIKEIRKELFKYQLPEAEALMRNPYGVKLPHSFLIAAAFHRILCMHQREEDTLMRGFEKHPEAAEIIIRLTKCFGTQGKYKEALLYAGKAIQIAPKDVDAWFNFSTANSACDNHEEALKALAQAIALDTGDDDLLRCRAFILKRAEYKTDAKQVMGIVKNVYGDGSVNAVETFLDLAQLSPDHSKYFDEALRISVQVSGVESESTLRILLIITSQAVENEDLPFAVACFEECLPIIKELFGSDSGEYKEGVDYSALLHDALKS